MASVFAAVSHLVLHSKKLIVKSEKLKANGQLAFNFSLFTFNSCVGLRGFEPMTFALSKQRSKPAELKSRTVNVFIFSLPRVFPQEIYPISRTFAR